MLARVPGAADVKAEQTRACRCCGSRIDREAIARYGINAAGRAGRRSRRSAGETVGTVLEGSGASRLQVRFARRGPRTTSDAHPGICASAGADGAARAAGAARRDRDRGRPGADQPRERSAAASTSRRTCAAATSRSFVAEAQEAVERAGRAAAGLGRSSGAGSSRTCRRRPRGSRRGAAGAAADLRAALHHVRLGPPRGADLPQRAVRGRPAACWRSGAARMPFSISAGVGFIALFGVAVLNGVVLVSYIVEQRPEGHGPQRGGARRRRRSGCGRC